MKKIFLILTHLLLISSNGYSQNNDTFYFYEFQLHDITDPDDAKQMIIQMRELTGEVIFYFNNDTDTFKLKSKKEYPEGEFIKILIDQNFRPIIR